MSNDLGIDRSGNDNSWTVSNASYADQMLDNPTNNFATWNSIHNGDTGTFSEGNLKLTTGSGTTEGYYSTIAAQSGKWYAEFLVGAAGTQNMYGIASNVYNNSGNGFRGGTQYSYALGQGAIWANGGEGSSLTTTFSVGDIFSVAMDLDNNDWYVARNNTYYNSGNGIGIEANNTYHFSWTFDHDGAAGVSTVNFGQDSSFAAVKTAQGNQDGNGVGDFFYAPPAGFLALCTDNIDDVIVPSEHFNTVLYTGDGSEEAVTGVGFQPDWIWVKGRNASVNHKVFDAVRGLGSLRPNTTGGENTDTSENLTSYNSDGFTIKDPDYITNTRTIVAWNWKANGVGSSNTNGSINTTKTSANVDAGFSINTWVGTGATATIGHGLSKAPELILVKNRDDADNWCVLAMVGGADATDFLRLDSDQAIVDDADRWNDTAPTSSVFTVDTDNQVNGDDDKMLAYCFHSVDGYSKVGFYIGNGSAGSANQFDGTFVHTGFKPKFLLFKRLDTGARWYIWDDAREPHNPMDSWLNLQGTNVETTALTSGYEQQLDFVSNGFKLKGPNGGINSIGRTFIFLAFAETPFKYSNAR